MQLSIITPEKVLFSAEAEMVTIPGSEGEFGVLSGHAPFISTLRPGVVTVEMKNGETQRIVVAGGVAEAMQDRCTVLAGLAEDCTTITSEQAIHRLSESKIAVDQAVTEDEKQTAARKLAIAEALCA